jgi:CRP/FNR family transcriptional regulator, anaerobic regulatory protein
LSRGEQVQTAGSATHRLLIVTQGRLRVVHIEPSGSEHVVRILGPGDYVGETSFVLGSPPEHFAFADAPTVVCVWEHRDLGVLVSSFPDIAVRMLQATTRRLLTAERLLAAFASSDVATRLAAYLLALPRVPGRTAPVRVRLPLAQKDVASYLGTTPETLSRRMGDLVRDEVIARHGRRDIDLLVIEALRLRAALV